MADAQVSTDSGWQARADAARAQFKAEGVNVSAWARDRGFEPKLVHMVLRGDRPCRFGTSHKIAVATGIKNVVRESETA